MRKLAQKQNILIVLMIVLLLAFTGALTVKGIAHVRREQQKRSELRLEGIDDLLERLSESGLDTFEVLYQSKLRSTVDLTVYAAQRAMENGRFEGEQFLEDGMIVRVENSRIICPEDSGKNIPEIPDRFWEEQDPDNRYFYADLDLGEDGKSSILVVWGAISDEYYCLDWIDEDDLGRYMLAYDDQFEVLREAEDTYGGYLLIMDAETPNLEFLYCSEAFSDYEDGASMGITRQLFNEKKGSFELDGKTYSYSGCHRKTLSTYSAILFLLPEDRVIPPYIAMMLVIVAVAMLFMTGMLVWHVSLRKLVQEEVLTEREKECYAPARVRRVTVLAAILGVICVFGVSILEIRMMDLYLATLRCQQAIDILEKKVDVGDDWNSSADEEEDEWHVYFAKQVASILADSPDLMNSEALQAMSSIIGSRYIMLFDAEGWEIMCSEPYVNFAFGTDPESSTYDFRRLLKGVDSIVHEPVVDETSGINTQLIGVPLKLSDGRLGALILAEDPYAETDEDKQMRISAQMNLLTPPEDLSMIIDPEENVVLYTNDESLVGCTTQQLELPTEQLVSMGIDTFSLNGKRYYGAYDHDDNGLLYFYFSSIGTMTEKALPSAALISGCFLVVILLFSMALLRDYRQEDYEKACREAEKAAKPRKRRSVAIASWDGKIRETVDPPQRWEHIFGAWDDQEPAKKTMVVVRIMLGLMMIIALLLVFSDQNSGRATFLRFILEGKWSRGFNHFAMVSIVLLVAAVSLLLLLLQAVFRIISGILGTKGETVCRLLLNLLEYVSVIIVLFYSFKFLGLDTGGLISAVGLLSLAVSLGAKDLVEDILAGITIVFDGEFQVGDIVLIDGFRGTVEEVGVRSTKLLDQGNNVKIIGNRDVKNVLNLSRRTSWYVLEISIPIDEPIERIEEMLNRELPELGKKYQEIISGPYYKGVTSMGKGVVTIAILTEYKEEDYRKVQREINHEVKLLFEREGFKNLMR